MTLSLTPRTHSVAVPGATLHYEVRGDHGPLLLVIGSPMAAADFAAVADALAGDRTVVTYDPRGYAHSPVTDPQAPGSVEQRAADVAAILDALGAQSADVFGSSGGAVTGLALAAGYPGRVSTLVAHEPPLLELLDDAPEQRAGTEAIIETFRRDGFPAAWAHFMANAGFDLPAEPDAAAPQGLGEDDARHAARFFEIDLRPTTGYLPDVAALNGTRVVVGIGAESGPLLTYRTSVALGALLGSTPVEFPGDHGGFMSHPEAFADRLRTVLSD